MAERLYAGLSAHQRAARRRQQLLAAGLEVFADHGWSGSTVADVCRSARLSPRYFYELFDDREDLFLAVTAALADDVQDVVARALAQAADDPQRRARAVLTALAGFFAADARVVRVALVESLATERLRQQRRELLAGFALSAARLMRPLRDGPVTGTRARRRLELSAVLLTGGMVEALIAWTDDGQPLSTELLVDHLADLCAAAARL